MRSLQWSYIGFSNIDPETGKGPPGDNDDWISNADIKVHNWIYDFYLQRGLEPTKKDIYVASLYYILTTVTTVGYGDITPVNTGERVYAIFLTVVGGAIYGYIIASMASIVSSLDANDRLVSEKMDSIISYMDKR